MFEDSLVESQPGQQSATKRWTMIGSTALQAAIAATLITLPLLHPEGLRFHPETPLVFTPPLPKPPLQVRQAVATQGAVTAAISVPSAAQLHSSLIPRDPSVTTDTPPVTGSIHFGSAIGNDLPLALTNGSSQPAAVRAAQTEPAKRVSISTGVSAGMLLTPIRPVYPAIARAASISGAVVVEAVISKTGRVESLRVLSGPEMLRKAALDAIREARYRPYLLNGDPTEIQTTFTVNFRLGS